MDYSGCPNTTHDVVLPVLSIAIVILLIILLIFILYVAFIKWKKGRRVEKEDDEFRMHLTNTTNRHKQSIASMPRLQKMVNGNIKAISPYVPEHEDEEFQNGSHLGCSTCDADSSFQGIAVKVSGEQHGLLTPNSCGSGRLDHELSALLQTDMKEDVITKIEGKLLVGISREIDDAGGILVLDKMGVSLLIPPCAIPRGMKQIIQLILSWDGSDSPPVTDTQSLMSPMVHCGPHGLKLAKPAILSFMHCADDARDIVVLSSETHLTQDKHWKPIQHRKKCGKIEYALLENQCQVYLSHFSMYTAISQGTHFKLTKKWIQLAAFGKKEGGQFQTFIYMLNNTPCALQFATYQQAKHDCTMIRCPLEFLMDEKEGDLIFDLKHVSEGWNPIGRKWEDIGLLTDIWKEKCNNVSFTFKHDNPLCIDLNFSICLYQKGMPDVKRHFEVAMSFPSKNPIKSTENHSHATTNLNVHVTQAVPSMAINGFESTTARVPPHTTPIKSTEDRRKDDFVVNRTMDNDHNNEHSLGRDVAKSSTVVDEVDLSNTKGNQKGDDNMSITEQDSVGHSRSINTTNINIHTETVVQPSSNLGFHRDILTLQGDQQTVVFPLRLRSKLMALLDPPSPVTSSVNDWRVLAESLHLDALVSLIRMKPSPTEELLDVAAQKGKDCRWLYGVLRDAERYDAADEVAKYLQSGSESIRLKNHMNGGDTEARMQ
ncbi:LOW QUALITY PROTEIN: netrin receptor UNC5A-like [Lytechinus variegatus]|uniref:LOW QUALITY PROTEIN: netrin receptor UNC5A-like n=1 Tax=Lytechinus variegatus TaxID=7654 RepID=UPI001BB23AD1|nr:LOW QUALITY PROTEIN: netrin receptor UNC5A-like [Lytechinus variegatus]